MKNIITTILITLLTYSLYAQVPGIGQVPFGMKYQAVARGADGQAMNSEDITLQFTILRDNTPVFTEVQATNTNDLGLFVLTIGSVNNTDFSNIDWRLGDHFLKVEVNDGGWQDLGTHQLLSVPYAMTAGNGKIVNPEFNDEILRIHGSNSSNNVVLGGNGTNNTLNNGTILVTDENSQWKVAMQSNHNSNAGDFQLRGRNNNNNILMGPVDAGNNADFGVLRIFDDEGVQRVTAFSAPGRDGAGLMDIRGANNNLNLSFGTTDISNIDYGAMRVHAPDGATRILHFSSPNKNGAGTIHLTGENNSFNVTMGATANNNHGRVYVHDADGTIKATLGVRDNGSGLVQSNDMIADGFIAAHIKNFFMDHPKDPTKEIWYACIEGPEAAAYERGTAQLVDGEVRVDFSEHFELVANPETMTVILTPNSAASEGLAVIEKTATGIKVKELRNGTGNYKFDWEVKCVRKGFEDYKVIRDKAEMERLIGIDPTDGNTQK